MSNPLLGITVAALFTALVQSSSATTGITIVLASQGFITLEAGIALVLGANVGTCVTAVLAALGKPIAAKQAAAAHLIYNILGVLIWLPFIGYLAEIVRDVSPSYPDLTGTVQLAAETPRQIANAHTIFNIANTIIFIGFTGYLAAFIQRIMPEKPEVLPEYSTPKYLEEELLETPSLALDRIKLETLRLGEYIEELTSMARPAVLYGKKEDLDRIVSREYELRVLHDAITDYARKLFSMEMSSAETRRLETLGIVLANLQHVAETISVNMVSIGRERLKRGFVFSEETLAQFAPYSAKVRESFDLSLKALKENDTVIADKVLNMKNEVETLAAGTVEHLARRLLSDDPNRAVLYRVESHFVDLIQRIYYFSSMISKEILEEAEAS